MSDRYPSDRPFSTKPYLPCCPPPHRDPLQGYSPCKLTKRSQFACCKDTGKGPVCSPDGIYITMNGCQYFKNERESMTCGGLCNCNTFGCSHCFPSGINTVNHNCPPLKPITDRGNCCAKSSCSAPCCGPSYYCQPKSSDCCCAVPNNCC